MAAVTAIVSTGLAVAGAVQNFSQAAKQGELQRKAQDDAEKAAKAAKDKLEQNFYEGLDINLKSFQQERDSLAGVGERLVEAGQEGERGAGAIAGQVMLGMQKNEQNITNRQINSLEKLEQTVAKEESRLGEERIKLDLEESAGAQIAAKEAGINRANAITAGVKGIGSAATGLMSSQKKLKDPKKLGDTKLGGLLSSVGAKFNDLYSSIFSPDDDPSQTANTEEAMGGMGGFGG